MGNASQGGFLSCCTNDVIAEQSLERLPPQKKIRPLLCDLQAQFEQHAGEDGLLDVHELTAIWKKAAEKKVGKLTDEDRALIEQSTKEFIKTMDMDKSGHISYEEFVAGMMGGSEGTHQHRPVRSELNKKLKDEPKRLQRLIAEFKEWDKNGDGYITPAELEEHLQQLKTAAMADGKIDAHEARELSEVTQMMEDIYKYADVDGDGKVDLWEVMAYVLGRKKQPVELLLYDISKGMASKLGPMLLGKRVEAVHSSVLAFGSEYWYGGKVFRSDPPCSKQFGNPLTDPWGLKLEQSAQRPDLPAIRLGYTFVTHEEFVVWLKDNLSARYTGLEKYDLLTHSCNHFSNEICNFLLGVGIPERIFELQRTFLSGPILAVRPFLNRMLGGFADAHKELGDDFMAKDQDVTGSADGVAEQVLGSGDLVLIEGMEGIEGAVLATVLKEEDGKIEVKYFDPTEGHIKTMAGVPKSKMKKTAQE